MTETYVVFIEKNDPTTAFAMRTRTWDAMIQMHKDRYGESWEEKLQPYTLVSQKLSEAHAEALVQIMKAPK